MLSLKEIKRNFFGRSESNFNDFGFALDSSDINLWNIDLADTHTFRFVRCRYPHFSCHQDVLKMFSRHVFKTSSRHVFKTSSRHLQHNNFSSSKTSSIRLARCLQDVFRTSSRRLQDVLEDKNFYTEDVLKTSSRPVWKMSSRRLAWRPRNVCWDNTTMPME